MVIGLSAWSPIWSVIIPVLQNWTNAKRESDLFNHEDEYRLNDLSRIPVNKGTNSRVGWTNTVICMKLSIRVSTSFLYVCSLERNSGKVYWTTQSPVTN